MIYIYIYIYIYTVCRGQKSVGGIVWPKHAHAQSKFGAVKTDLWHPRYSFRLCSRTALACTKKKRSLRNGKLKVNISSETEDRGKKGWG